MTDIIDRTAYDPKLVEAKWYQYWLDLGLFHADVHSDKPAYCIVIPPPNVTGALHIGHALQDTIMDLLTRYKRARGHESLWLPGTDHAGIATQAVVERHLKQQRGLTRHDLGREAFLQETWRWKEEYHARITEQLKRMGCGLDWARERFTMDEGCSRAVREAFCRFYEAGLIYRGLRIIHWCPQDHTALSDEEVEHFEQHSHLWTIEYPLEDGSGAVQVATTRPETMLGDTGVAVHPDDKRYHGLVGKNVILPLMERPIPIVADERVDPAFGTGAVKVTPAHDPLDFDIGETHSLELLQVIGEDGTMTELAGRYAGLDRFACRKRVLEDLTAQGRLVKTEDYVHSVGRCSRCDTIIEPLASEQWFVRMKPLADLAIQASQAGKLRFVPQRWEKVYLDWLYNIRDWCISRQLWWGHRIPVWYCEACGATMCLRNDPEKCAQCGSPQLRQDEDVLDTWFSSGLWPFSTLGWPDDTEDLRRFFPTSVLVTGYDIIFFWVARMTTMSLFFTGQIPFHTVFITGLVRDERGRKYSKSLANQIDPLDLVEQYGTDALRFSLTSLITHGQDIRFGPQRVEGARHFCNKLYNATRFVCLNLQDFDPSLPSPKRSDFALADRWILSRLNRCIETTTQHIENYDLADAARGLHEFVWGEFCDWYVELSKPALQGCDPQRRRVTQYVLWRALSAILRMLHPIMPFITEELWHALPGSQGSVHAQRWPVVHRKSIDPQVEQQLQPLMDAVYGVRTIRADYDIPPGAHLIASLRPDSPAAADTILSHADQVKFLARLSELNLLHPAAPNPDPAFRTVVGAMEVFVHAEGAVDLHRQRERLEKELAEARGHLSRVEAKLSNPNFTQRAPEHVVQREHERRGEIEERIAKLEGALDGLRFG